MVLGDDEFGGAFEDFFAGVEEEGVVAEFDDLSAGVGDEEDGAAIFME